jgi:hypothetical protein
MLLISPQPRSAHSCTVDLGMPGSGCVAHICSGERPLAMPLPITEALRAAPSPASPMPRLASEGSASAAPCACDARQNTCGPPSGRSRRARGTRCSASATRPAWGTSRPGRPAPARPPGPRRPHEPVPGDLVVDRRGRPAEVGRHRPAALVAAQPPLHGEPVGLREPRVGPSGPVRPPLRAIPAVLRHPRHPNPGGDARAGLSGPQASGSATQPYVCGWVAESFGWNSDSR